MYLHTVVCSHRNSNNSVPKVGNSMTVFYVTADYYIYFFVNVSIRVPNIINVTSKFGAEIELTPRYYIRKQGYCQLG